MTVFALMGANALWFLYLWLASCIIAGYLSNRKGYGDKAGRRDGPVPVGGRDHRVARLAGEAGVQVEGHRTLRLAARTPPVSAS